MINSLRRSWEEVQKEPGGTPQRDAEISAYFADDERGALPPARRRFGSLKYVLYRLWDIGGPSLAAELLRVLRERPDIPLENVRPALEDPRLAIYRDVVLMKLPRNLLKHQLQVVHAGSLRVAVCLVDRNLIGVAFRDHQADVYVARGQRGVVIVARRPFVVHADRLPRPNYWRQESPSSARWIGSWRHAPDLRRILNALPRAISTDSEGAG